MTVAVQHLSPLAAVDEPGHETGNPASTEARIAEPAVSAGGRTTEPSSIPPMSQAGSQASAFYREVAAKRVVWTLSDKAGFPAPMTTSGKRAQPFWSLRARVERIISTVPAYAGFAPFEIPWNEFRESWVPELTQDGILAGVNWERRARHRVRPRARARCRVRPRDHRASGLTGRSSSREIGGRLALLPRFGTHTRRR